ncbi:hypothetical protein GLOTRDRAFT_133174 [Gloeophyllum trabeum ATCC 11539]|uniref:Uncharacterized protein n=1 Tax=Gloeophyllum trabeum (strain ATCC 11539 / FP-39264 / Madison 617) TaxID=670483 RepID=S7PV08_GLOTA|nr:uncharacterized protein GLOTRDRAFT_133174 [Gloeophyllum trabeum ATCC 11539]EPQ51303.1 hypothetical protein GLOTRDRAFT_133174 [Gloeophyllum trabeum ATCC 11539]
MGGSRKNAVKPKKHDVKGKSREIVKSEDDKSDVKLKIMIKGTKRKTDLDDISGDERDSNIQEVDVKASVNKSAKRAKTNLAVGKHVEIRKKGVEFDEGEVKSDEGSDDEVCIPGVKGYGSDDENSHEHEEVKDEAMELPVVRGRQTPTTPEPPEADDIVQHGPDVTLKEELMDPLLKATYVNLPHLPR